MKKRSFPAQVHYVSSEEESYIKNQDELEAIKSYEKQVSWLLGLLFTPEEQFIFEKKIPKQATNKEIMAYTGLSAHRLKKAVKKIETRLLTFRKFLACLPAPVVEGRQSGRDRQR